MLVPTLSEGILGIQAIWPERDMIFGSPRAAKWGPGKGAGNPAESVTNRESFETSEHFLEHRPDVHEPYDAEQHGGPEEPHAGKYNVTENSRFKTVQTDPAVEKQTEDRADYAPDSTSGWQGHGAKGFLQVFPKYLKIALHY